jgi:hypothetical protein
MFTGATPKMTDSDIKSLIRKYPPPPNIKKLMQQIKDYNNLEESAVNDYSSRNNEGRHPDNKKGRLSKTLQ